MNITDIREMNDAEIDRVLDEARAEMLNLRIQLELGKLDDFTRIKELKVQIARLLTVQRERELAAELVAALEP